MTISNKQEETKDTVEDSSQQQQEHEEKQEANDDMEANKDDVEANLSLFHLPDTVQDDNLPQQRGNDTERSSQRKYPDPFYDSTTGKVMQDPVVDTQGDSHERTPNMMLGAYYPNRALQEIIQEHVALSEESLRGSFRRLDHAIQSNWHRLVDQSAFKGMQDPYHPLPNAYYCPISAEIMTDPVITREGITYERSAIETWINDKHTSPMTRNPLVISDIRPNNAIYDLIQLEKEGHGTESTHPSIRRWRESGAASTRPDVTASGAAPQTTDGAAQDEEEEEGLSSRCQVAIWFTIFIIILFVPYMFWVFLGLCCCLVCCGMCSHEEGE